MEKRIDKALTEVLVKAGLIASDFTGKLTLNYNQGGICDVEKQEKIKLK